MSATRGSHQLIEAPPPKVCLELGGPSASQAGQLLAAAELCLSVGISVYVCARMEKVALRIVLVPVLVLLLLLDPAG